MLCPSCGNLLQQLEVTTNSHGKFNVDHCGRCGGTWFDPYEINRIPYHEVARLAHLTVLPKKPIHQAANQLCPRCHKSLVPLQTDSVPSGVRLLRCVYCHGIWATQKALSEFKEKQQETITEYKTRQIAFPSLSVVFVPALFILLLLFTTLITVTNLQKAKDDRIKAAQNITNINITRISSTKTSVTFITVKPYRSLFSYGISQLEMVRINVSTVPAASHTKVLTDLIPGKTYLYRIILIDENGQEITGDLSFFTQ